MLKLRTYYPQEIIFLSSIVLLIVVIALPLSFGESERIELFEQIDERNTNMSSSSISHLNNNNNNNNNNNYYSSNNSSCHFTKKWKLHKEQHKMYSTIGRSLLSTNEECDIQDENENDNDNENEIIEEQKIHFEISSTPSEYIVRFKGYYYQSFHSRLVSSALKKRSQNEAEKDGKVENEPNELNEQLSTFNSSSWTILPRNNPASAFPSDFAILKMSDSATQAQERQLISTLLSSSLVKSVTPQRQVIRKLTMAVSSKQKSSEQTENPNKENGEPSVSASSDSYTLEELSEIEFKHGSRRGRFPMEFIEKDSSSSTDTVKGRKPLAGIGFNGSPTQVARLLRAEQIWNKGFSGKGVKVAVFDTGLVENHPHFRNVIDRTDWTNESTMDDVLGHGSFVAGVIASSQECLGFAPDAELYIFRVFTNQQVSYTSWFLDAFNYAIHKKINILNLSIGGPDFLDMPFVEKVWELSANGVIMISAIGNDGPLYGTLNNPADQSDVIGVGGLDVDGNVAHFSSRGMTTWELPRGYGRVKPDIVTHGHMVSGSHKESGCKTLSGTSVASPVVAGAVTLLASIINPAVRWNIINPASMKQALIEAATPVPNANIFEQGQGKLNLLGAFNILVQYTPRASFVPSSLDLTDCPRMWPFCTQPLYFGAMPLIFNVTILNGMGVSGQIVGSPVWQPNSNSGGVHLDVSFTYAEILWPWSGYLALHLTVKDTAIDYTGKAEGVVLLNILSPPQGSEKSPRVSRLTLPLRVDIIPTPPRKLRILWDQYHNLRYPGGYFPRDNLKRKEDPLDWNGDHIHTNFRDMYNHLRSQGYFIEVLGQPFTCFDARQYGTLLIVDSEEEFFKEEMAKLYSDIVDLGLSIIVAAEWYNTDVMKDKIKFFDENTKQWWTPVTGGANIPALNELFSPFEISLGSKVYSGELIVEPAKVVPNSPKHYFAPFLSGTSIRQFPAKGLVSFRKMTDQTHEMLKGLSYTDEKVPIMGLLQTSRSGGRIVVYGDSNCLDSAHSEGNCFWLLDMWLEYTGSGLIDPTLSSLLTELETDLSNTGDQLPMRLPNSKFGKYSKVVKSGSAFIRRQLPECFVPSPFVIVPKNGTIEDFDPHVDVAAGDFGRLVPVASGPKVEDSIFDTNDNTLFLFSNSLSISSSVFMLIALSGLIIIILVLYRSKSKQRKLWVV